MAAQIEAWMSEPRFGNVKNNRPELAPWYARAGYSSPTRSSPAVRDDSSLLSACRAGNTPCPLCKRG
jgi:hypothetical protein